MLPVIFALAWPTMLEELMQTLVQYIDTAMVGALGTEATAAVGATSTVGWMVGSSISALGIGFLAYIAKAHNRLISIAKEQAIFPILFHFINFFHCKILAFINYEVFHSSLIMTPLMVMIYISKSQLFQTILKILSQRLGIYDNCVTFTEKSNVFPLNFADFRRVNITRGMLSKA